MSGATGRTGIIRMRELIGQGVANIFSPMFGGLACDWSDRANGHQHSIGRAVAGRRHDSCADAAVHSALRGSAGKLRADGGAGWDF